MPYIVDEITFFVVVITRMGNWKKIQIPGSSGNQFYTPGPNLSVFGRNLTKDQLGGVIFGCKNATIKECLTKQLFGKSFLCD